LEDNITATLGGNTVGVIDMVNAYSTIANLGVEHRVRGRDALMLNDVKLQVEAS